MIMGTKQNIKYQLFFRKADFFLILKNPVIYTISRIMETIKSNKAILSKDKGLRLEITVKTRNMEFRSIKNTIMACHSIPGRLPACIVLLYNI